MIEWRYEEHGAELREMYPRPVPFLAIDPGNFGGVVSGCDTSQTLTADLERSGAVVASMARQLGAGLWVVENQYVFTNPRMSLQMAQRIGLVLGMAIGQLQQRPVHVVWVQPKEWQVILAAGPGARRAALERKALETCSIDLTESGLTKKERTGIAAADGIARWFQRRMKWQEQEQDTQLEIPGPSRL